MTNGIDFIIFPTMITPENYICPNCGGSKFSELSLSSLSKEYERKHERVIVKPGNRLNTREFFQCATCGYRSMVNETGGTITDIHRREILSRGRKSRHIRLNHRGVPIRAQ
ncbi:MAG TPA: hypothetical protein ENH82_14040 [bacterium]|nr:hypothetical protein [bacterium]